MKNPELIGAESESDESDLYFEFLEIDGPAEENSPFKKVAWMRFKFKKDFNYVDWSCAN